MSDLSTSLPKRCRKCGELKTVADFHRDSSRSDGRQAHCRECVRSYRKSYDQRPEVKEQSRAWDENHRERVRAASARWRARQTVPRVLSPEARERRLESSRKRRKAHGVRVSVNISNAMRKSVRSDKGGRAWETLVGYALAELISHLEARFVDGMTWANYGEWHIDHVRPVASFSITSVECDDFRACWSLSNLQPLWAADNIAKGARYKEAPASARREGLPELT